jgi:hypothetical protein
MFSIEDRIWDGQSTTVSVIVGRMFGQSPAASRQVGVRGNGFWDDLNAPTVQRHCWVRNAHYVSMDPRNPLKSQQMRSLSERTPYTWR